MCKKNREAWLPGFLAFQEKIDRLRNGVLYLSHKKPTRKRGKYGRNDEKALRFLWDTSSGHRPFGKTIGLERKSKDWRLVYENLG